MTSKQEDYLNSMLKNLEAVSGLKGLIVKGLQGSGYAVFRTTLDKRQVRVSLYYPSMTMLSNVVEDMINLSKAQTDQAFEKMNYCNTCGTKLKKNKYMACAEGYFCNMTCFRNSDIVEERLERVKKEEVAQ